MPPFLQPILDWLDAHQGLLWAAGAGSLLVIIASAVAIPAIVVRLRPDYFARGSRPEVPWSNRHPGVRVALRIAKNTLGGLFILAGLAMLVLPGQGLLTIFIGFMLLDFPGKFRVERWLVRRRFIHRPINWLRRRAGREPLVLDRDPDPSPDAEHHAKAGPEPEPETGPPPG